MKTWSYQGVPTKIQSPKVILKSCYVLMCQSLSSFKVFKQEMVKAFCGVVQQKEKHPERRPTTKVQGRDTQMKSELLLYEGKQEKTAEQKA